MIILKGLKIAQTTLTLVYFIGYFRSKMEAVYLFKTPTLTVFTDLQR